MDVTSILAADDSTAAPRTPPRRDGADDETPGRDRDGVDDESLEDSEPDSGEEEEEEELMSTKKVRGRRKWVVLGTWDRTEVLDSEIDAEILCIATEKVE